MRKDRVGKEGIGWVRVVWNKKGKGREDWIGYNGRMGLGRVEW